MLLADKGSKKGISVKLNPAEEHRIFVDGTDDGKSIHIVKGRVVRVDEPSQEMRNALNDRVYGPAENRRTLLVETDEDPTPLPEVTPGATASGQVNNLSDLQSLAEKLGFNLTPATVEVAGKTETAPVSEDAGTGSKTSDTNGSGGKK